MVIALSGYPVDGEQFVGGANLYYSEAAQLLAEQAECQVHSFPALLGDSAQARSAFSGLGEEDIVLSNAGPYAYVYAFLREKLKSRFRIVREVQAAFHAGYLLQEELCAPRMRDGDLVLFPSAYCRQLYLQLFPDFLDTGNTRVCYPLPRIPAESGIPAARGGVDWKTSPLRLGYLGRVSAEKNVDQLLAAARRLRSSGTDILLSLVGQEELANSPHTIQDTSGAGWIFRSSKRLSHAAAIRELASFDLLLFPSTSSMETLGRVLLEAAQLGVPALAACHAATPEFMDSKTLLPVEYVPGYYPLFSGNPLGRISEEALAGLIQEIAESSLARCPLADMGRFEQDRKQFSSIIRGTWRSRRRRRLARPIREFLDRIGIHHRGSTIDLRKGVGLAKEVFARRDYRHIGAVLHFMGSRLSYRPVLRIE